jgi:hypothetical protein
MAFQSAAPVPGGGRTVTTEAPAGTESQRVRPAVADPRREPLSLRVLAYFQFPVAALGLAAGTFDLVASTGIASKALGLVMLLFGALVLVGIMACGRRPSDNQRRVAAAGAIAGVVIAVIFILAALGYQNFRACLFAASGIPSAAIAIGIVRWELIRANAGLAAVAAVASAGVSFLPFAYNTIYLPTTADVAIESTVTAGAPVPVGKNLDLVDLTLTVENLSTIQAVDLTSMLEVEGVTYGGSSANYQAPPNESDAVAIGLTGHNYPNLDTSATSEQHLRTPTLVTLQRPITDGSFLHPGLKLIGTVPVLLPVGKYRELEVRFYLSYARADRLILTNRYFGPRFEENEGGCSDDVRTAWHISQTALDFLARGEETVVTDWCATVTDPWIKTFVGGAPGTHTPSAIVSLADQNYQTREQTRFWDIELPAS